MMMMASKQPGYMLVIITHVYTTLGPCRCVAGDFITLFLKLDAQAGLRRASLGWDGPKLLRNRGAARSPALVSAARTDEQEKTIFGKGFKGFKNMA